MAHVRGATRVATAVLLLVAVFLTTPITNADQIGDWTDSIFNASLPLPRGPHAGVRTKGAGGAVSRHGAVRAHPAAP